MVKPQNDRGNKLVRVDFKRGTIEIFDAPNVAEQKASANNLIFIGNENPIYWEYCPKCGKKLSKDIQKECYWVGCKKCHVTYRVDDRVNELHEKIDAQKIYIQELEAKVKNT